MAGGSNVWVVVLMEDVRSGWDWCVKLGEFPSAALVALVVFFFGGSVTFLGVRQSGASHCPRLVNFVLALKSSLMPFMEFKWRATFGRKPAS
ncbi:hypothetical protein QQ045_012031 [Rhodiola kirilowii]